MVQMVNPLLKPLAKLDLKNSNSPSGASARRGSARGSSRGSFGYGCEDLKCVTKRAVPMQKQIRSVEGELTDQYTVLAVIHDGGDQCRVKRVKSKDDGREYVMKIQGKSKIRSRDEEFFRETTVRIMNMPENENVVRIHDCFEDADYFYTLQEACDGGTLSDFLDFLDVMNDATMEKEVRRVMGELLLSLEHLHKEGLVHKDVKLDNLVFKEKGVLNSKKEDTETNVPSDEPVSPTGLKLIDFDFTEDWEPATPKSRVVVGTDGYIAPEAYLGDVCPKSDIFSAGVIMFALVEGQYPYAMSLFDDKPNQNYVGCYKMQEIYDKLSRSEVAFGSCWKNMGQAKDFCRALLEFDVDKRPSAEEALNHPWMEKFAGTVIRRRLSQKIIGAQCESAGARALGAFYTRRSSQRKGSSEKGHRRRRPPVKESDEEPKTKPRAPRSHDF